MTVIFYSWKSETDGSSRLNAYILDGGSLKFKNSFHWYNDENKYYPVKILSNNVFLIEHSKERLIWDADLDDKFE